MNVKVILSMLFVCVLLLATPCLAETGLTSDVTVTDDVVTISGTAVNNVSRVDIRVDGQNWHTASGVLPEWQYEGTFDTGSHYAEVQAISSTGEYDTLFLPFDVDYEALAGDDLSWFISITDVEFLSEEGMSVREVVSGDDVLLMFDIENGHSADARIRYTIEKGIYSVQDDTFVDAGDSETVKEWVLSADLSDGVNRFTVTLEDWDTKEIIAEKVLSVEVVPVTSVVISDEEIPEWFVSVAEYNNLTLVESDTNRDLLAEIQKLNDKIDEQNDKIGTLNTDIKNLKSTDGTSTGTQKASIADSENFGVYVLLLLGALFYAYKKGYLNDVLKPVKDTDAEEKKPEDLVEG